MEIRTSAEVDEIIEAYACAVMEVQLSKKVLDGQIKDIKQDAKEDGIAISKVMSQISKIKAEAKKSEADRLEEELLNEKLQASEKVQDLIIRLNAEQ